MVIHSETKSEERCNCYWLVNLCFKYFINPCFFPELHTVCGTICKNVWDIHGPSDAGLCGKLSERFSGILSRAPVIRMFDCDQPGLDLSWTIRQWKHLHPAFNPTWCSVTGIEKSKKSLFTGVLHPKSLGKMCSVSCLGGDSSGYILESSY